MTLGSLEADQRNSKEINFVFNDNAFEDMADGTRMFDNTPARVVS